MTNYTRSEILANRQKWTSFLKVKGRRKACSVLDDGQGKRCCLGHAAYVLGLKRISASHSDYIRYGNAREYAYLPIEGVEMLGLWDRQGRCVSGFMKFERVGHSSLAELNDNSDITPKQVGELLDSMIEGGAHTPFRPLTDYPE